jgi:hypothetical protein
MHHNYLVERYGRMIDKRYSKVYRLEGFDTIIKSRKSQGCGFTLGDFRNGENSGFCGLQLAVILGFDEIYLLGMDLCIRNGTHYHSLYPNQHNFDTKLKLYAENFRLGIADIKQHTDIKVFSCSSFSALNDVLDYIPVEEVLCSVAT